MALTKHVDSIDAANQRVFIRQGLVVVSVTLDPWPATEAEQKSQALAQAPDIDADEANLPARHTIQSDTL